MRKVRATILSVQLVQSLLTPPEAGPPAGPPSFPCQLTVYSVLRELVFTIDSLPFERVRQVSIWQQGRIVHPVGSVGIILPVVRTALGL